MKNIFSHIACDHPNGHVGVKVHLFYYGALDIHLGTTKDAFDGHVGNFVSWMYI